MKVFNPSMIIWSADNITMAEIREVVLANVLPAGTVIKLDRLFFERNEKANISWLQSKGYPVFCDAKIIEIPAKALAIAESYLEFHPFMLNIMAGACSTNKWFDEDVNQVDALKRFAELCVKSATKSCMVTVLTSKSEAVCKREFGTSSIKKVMDYVSMAQHAGMSDIVCSPKEVAEIRSDWTYDAISLNTPGVRPKGSSNDDQQRVATPAQAILDGADRVVIGRPLLAGEGSLMERIERNYAAIRKEIEDALNEQK